MKGNTEKLNIKIMTREEHRQLHRENLEAVRMGMKSRVKGAKDNAERISGYRND